MSWLNKIFGLENKESSDNIATIPKPDKKEQAHSLRQEKEKQINEINFYFWRKNREEIIPGTLDKRVTKGVFGARIHPTYLNACPPFDPFSGPLVEDENKEIFWKKVSDTVKTMDLRQQNYEDFKPTYFDAYKEKYPTSKSLEIHRIGIVKAVCYVKDEVDETLMHGNLRWHVCAELGFFDENKKKLHDHTVMATLAFGLTIEDAIDGLRKFQEYIDPSIR